MTRISSSEASPHGSPDEERVLLPAEDDELNGLAGGPQPRDVVRHAVVHRGVDRGAGA